MRLVLVAVVVAAAACHPGDDAVEPGSGGGGAATTTTGGPIPVTYHRDVRPLLEAHCMRCHADGGAAPDLFSDPAAIPAIGSDVVDRVVRGEMPPYQPRDGCRELSGVPVFPLEGIARLAAWRDGGFVVGDPADYPGPSPLPGDPRPPLGPPDQVVSLAPFAPEPASDDQVHEQVVEGAFAADTWLVATEILPGAPAIVHHATAFLEPVSETPPPVPAPTSIVGAFAPGYAPVRLPQGAALFAPAGARMRVLVHYSVVGLSPGDPVPTDTTTVRLWTLPAGAVPTHQAFFDAVSASDLFLPAGAPEVVVAGESALRFPDAPIVGVMPHMHLRGASFHADLVTPAGDACLVDVPSYDFAHQALYLFAAPVPVGDGASHRMACTFDNSPANQPIVGGMLQPTRDVVWGDASTDEMCQNALLRLAPLP